MKIEALELELDGAREDFKVIPFLTELCLHLWWPLPKSNLVYLSCSSQDLNAQLDRAEGDVVEAQSKMRETEVMLIKTKEELSQVGRGR